MKKILFPILALFLLIVSCDNNGKDSLRSTVDSFSVAYFNWQFQRAVPYTDAQSVRWLSYAASQVRQEDVDSLRAMEQGASIKIEDIDIHDDDSTATAEITVTHFLSFDSIGKAPHVIEEATFFLPAVRRHSVWKIALTALPSGICR